jgi:predicted helicase
MGVVNRLSKLTSDSKTRKMIAGIGRQCQLKYRSSSLYRPFSNRWLYFDRLVNERVYQWPRAFPGIRSIRFTMKLPVPVHGSRITTSGEASEYPNSSLSASSTELHM